MPTEFEAKFLDINKEDIIKKLLKLGAIKVFDEKLMRRCVYDIPNTTTGTWARVRDEGNGIVTITYKHIRTNNVDGVEEIEIATDNFEQARKLLTKFGLKERGYQENKRLRYKIEDDNVEFDIDTWPALEPYLEIEANSSELVKKYAGLLDLDWDTAMFGSTDLVYAKIYNITPDFINNSCQLLTFSNIPNELKKHNKR